MDRHRRGSRALLVALLGLLLASPLIDVSLYSAAQAHPDSGSGSPAGAGQGIAYKRGKQAGRCACLGAAGHTTLTARRGVEWAVSGVWRYHRSLVGAHRQSVKS